MVGSGVGRPRRASFWIGAILASVIFSFPAHAGTVEVLVRERRGPPVSGQLVVIHPPIVPGERVWHIDRAKRGYGTTGANGKVVLEGLPGGSYMITLDKIEDPNLINPSANPYAPPPLLTLASDSDKVSIEIELWRGVFFSAEVFVDRGNVPRATAVLRSLDGAAVVEVPLGPAGRAERLLVPGRWEAGLEFPPGYLLTDLVWNGESLPGHTARLDVTDDTRGQYVTWFLSARSLITGRISVEGRGGCTGTVVATLVQPGSWYPAAVARGGSQFQRVPAQEVLPDCSYLLWLPDGTWSVRPEGDDVTGSMPEFVDLTIAPGETRSVSFVLKAEEDPGKKSNTLRVTVRAPDERSLVGAAIEVWPPAGPAPGAEPLRTAKTESPWFGAEIRGLAAGDYLVVAGRADYIENTARVEDFDPKADEPVRVTVSLREGARIHGRAVDEKGKRVSQVELDVVRLGDPPKTLLANEEIAARKKSARVLTDLTGHAEVPGLYAGDYRVTGHVTGEMAGTRFVLLHRGEGKPVPDMEICLGEAERVDLDLLVLPAASLAGNLACSDEGSLPAGASFRVFSFGSAIPDPWRDRDLRKESAFASDDLRLTGKHLDRFRVGPLPPGSYLLAVRPGGYEFWSWVFDLLMPKAATVFQATETSNLNIGVVTLECGPLMMVVPGVLSGESLPDFRLASIDARAVSGEAADLRAPFGFEAEYHEERAFLRRLSEGKSRLSIVVKHPYLIPPSLSLPEQDVDLVRGKLVTVTATFQKVGGLVEVRCAGAAARLIPAEGDPAIRPTVDGKASFPGTLPGTYRAEACEDATCAHVTHTWDCVQVAAARTVIVGEPR